MVGGWNPLTKYGLMVHFPWFLGIISVIKAWQFYKEATKVNLN